MKKVINSFIMVFALGIIMFTSNVYADTCKKGEVQKACSSRTIQECTTLCGGYDEDGNTCGMKGQSSSCTIYKYSNTKKKHCTYYDGTNCPATDDYGNQCYSTGPTLCQVYSGTGGNGDTQDNYDASGDVTCGNGLTFNKSIANITHYMVIIFQILAPVMLIILGSYDLAKAVSGGNDDAIKKAQSVFFKRLLTAVILFLVITIVRMVIGLLSNDTILSCFDCFVNGANKCGRG